MPPVYERPVERLRSAERAFALRPQKRILRFRLFFVYVYAVFFLWDSLAWSDCAGLACRDWGTMSVMGIFNSNRVWSDFPLWPRCENAHRTLVLRHILVDTCVGD